MMMNFGQGYYPPMPQVGAQQVPAQAMGGQQQAPAPVTQAPGVAQALAGANMGPVASPMQGAAQAAGQMVQAYQNASPQRQQQIGSIFGITPTATGGGLY